MFPKDALPRCPFSVFLGLVHILLKPLVKVLQHIAPIHLALGNHIKFFLDFSSEIEIHDLDKVLEQEIIYDHPNVRWEEFRSLYAGVLRVRLILDASTLQR